MISIETQNILEKFNTLVRRSVQANAKDIRMTTVDAVLLMGELSNVMARLAVMENSKTATAITDAHHFDGGKF
jgi:hypothetical protein